MQDSHLLVLSRVAKTYRAGVVGCSANVTVLRDASLALRPGELATVDGPRGSGKTTLLLCAAGMLRPDLGDVRWPSLTPRMGRSPAGICYVSERAPVYGFLTVTESLTYAATVRALDEPGVVPSEPDLLRIAGLGDVATQRVALLSKSEQSRLLIALALVLSPKLLLVDQVSGGPDEAGRTAFARCLARVASAGIGVVWSSRGIGAPMVATASYALADGRLRPMRASYVRKEEPTTDVIPAMPVNTQAIAPHAASE